MKELGGKWRWRVSRQGNGGVGGERGRELIAMGNGRIWRQMELEGKYTGKLRS